MTQYANEVLAVPAGTRPADGPQPAHDPYRRARQSLQAAVLGLMSQKEPPRFRLLSVILEDIANLGERDFPDGEPRAEFRRIMGRMMGAMSARGIQDRDTRGWILSDDEVQAAIEQIHRLAFSLAGTRPPARGG